MTHERLKCSTVNINHGTDFPILCMCYKKKEKKRQIQVTICLVLTFDLLMHRHATSI